VKPTLPATKPATTPPLPAVQKKAAAPPFPAAPAFPEHRIATTDAAGLRAILGGASPAPILVTGSVTPAAAAKAITANVHLLMEGGPEKYERVFVSPTHVALVRRSGIIDLVSHADAEAQIRSGQPMTPRRVDIGWGPRGRIMFAEEGPGGTIRLYRQLPQAAHGDLVTPDGYTSFALTEADAYHPFGPPGKTVTLSIPRPMFDRVVKGELGGTGWAGGGGLGIDVEEEMQIDSRVLKAQLEAPTR
jgi:hypothetical protein